MTLDDSNFDKKLAKKNRIWAFEFRYDEFKLIEKLGDRIYT